MNKTSTQRLQQIADWLNGPGASMTREQQAAACGVHRSALQQTIAKIVAAGIHLDSTHRPGKLTLPGETK